MNDLLEQIIDELDSIEGIELPTEDKVLYSKELLEKIQVEIRKEISKIPMGKIITKILEKESEKMSKETSSIKSKVEENGTNLQKELATLKEAMDTLKAKTREKHEKLTNQFLALGQDKLYFGGPVAMRIQEENGSDLGYPTSLKFPNGAITVNSDGSYSIDGGTTSSDAYFPTNVDQVFSYDAKSTSIDELANVLGTLINSLQGTGIIQGTTTFI